MLYCIFVSFRDENKVINAPHVLKIKVEAYNLKLETYFDYS